MTRAGYFTKNILCEAQLNSEYRANTTKKDMKQWTFIFKLNLQMIVSTQKTDAFDLEITACHSSDKSSTFRSK